MNNARICLCLRAIALLFPICFFKKIKFWNVNVMDYFFYLKYILKWAETSNCFDVESKFPPLCEKQPVLVGGVLCLNDPTHQCILYSSSRPYRLQLNGDETNQIDRKLFFLKGSSSPESRRSQPLPFIERLLANVLFIDGEIIFILRKLTRFSLLRITLSLELVFSDFQSPLGVSSLLSWPWKLAWFFARYWKK